MRYFFLTWVSDIAKPYGETLKLWVKLWNFEENFEYKRKTSKIQWKLSKSEEKSVNRRNTENRIPSSIPENFLAIDRPDGPHWSMLISSYV